MFNDLSTPRATPAASRRSPSRPAWSRRRGRGRVPRRGHARAWPGAPSGASPWHLPWSSSASATATTVRQGHGLVVAAVRVGIPFLPVFGWLGAAGELPALRDPAPGRGGSRGRRSRSPTRGRTSSGTRRRGQVRRRGAGDRGRAWLVHAVPELGASLPVAAARRARRGARSCAIWRRRGRGVIVASPRARAGSGGRNAIGAWELERPASPC